MPTLAYTLVSEGSSDRVLLPLLDWLLAQTVAQVFFGQWADLQRLPNRPRTLAEKVRGAQELYPCALLFVHRDADRESREVRVREIRRALGDQDAAVCVVPVKAQETWLLFDERALREAAGNPRGRQQLGLPRVGRLEEQADPKGLLHRTLVEASGFQGRKRRSFPTRERAFRLADLIDDFTPLMALPAFRALEADLREVAARCNWGVK